jgi:hypothetical protein
MNIERFFFRYQLSDGTVLTVTKLQLDSLRNGLTPDSWRFLSKASTLPLGTNQKPISCTPEAVPPGVKRPVRGSDHSPSSSAVVRNAWKFHSVVCLHGVVLN